MREAGWIDGGISTTLAKGLEVLEAFASYGRAATNAEIAEKIGLPRPSVARMTTTLVELGFLVRASRGKFEVGGRTLTLGYPVVTRLVDRQKARPLMREFAASTGGAVSIAVASDMDYVFVESVQPNNTMQHRPEVGFSAPLATTAMGRALLSIMQESRLKQYRQRMQRFRPEQWAAHGAQALAGMKACSKYGFCSVFGTWRADIFAFGSPLGRMVTGEVFAVNCGIPSWSMTPAQIEVEQIGQRLSVLADNIRTLMPLIFD